MNIEYLYKKFPKLCRFLWGKKCPECDFLMNTTYYEKFVECPNCNHREKA